MIDAATKAKLKDVIEAVQNVSKKRGTVEELRKQRAFIEKSQDRTRKNISSLSNVQGSATVDDNKLLLRFVQSLESSEDSIEKLHGQIEKLKAEVNAEQENVNQMIVKLSSSWRCDGCTSFTIDKKLRFCQRGSKPCTVMIPVIIRPCQLLEKYFVSLVVH